MIVNGQSISMIRGDSESIIISCAKLDGVLLPFLTGDTVYFTVKVCAETENKILQKVVTEFIDGRAIINIEPEDTKLLKFDTYVYDIQCNKLDGTVTTIIPMNSFTIDKEVTYE